MILNNIPNYDYVIWIDSDAFFRYDAKPITDVIEEYKQYDIIFSSDKYTNKNTSVNSGIFIVKNTEFSKNFLRKWGYDEKLHHYATSIKNNWHDQNALIYMIEHNELDVKNKSIILDYNLLQNFDNPFSGRQLFRMSFYISYAAGIRMMIGLLIGLVIGISIRLHLMFGLGFGVIIGLSLCFHTCKEENKAFIYHMAGQTNRYRYEVSKKYYETYFAID